MRPEELIRRANQKIAVEVADINRAVGRVVDGINISQCAHSVSQANNLPHVVDGPHRIGSVAGRHQPSARGDLPL